MKYLHSSAAKYLQIEGNAQKAFSQKENKSTSTRSRDISLIERLAHSTAPAAKASGSPRVFITGDLNLCVSESVVTTTPVRGSYRIEIEEISEPRQVIWSAEGRLLTDDAMSADIEFDLHGAKAGQTWTYVVTVQVTGSDGYNCIVCSVFVQILVTGKDPLCQKV